MAKQFKMQKDGVTVYPQTITDAIADPQRGKTLKAALNGLDLQDDVTATAAVGKVPSGAKFTAGTTASDILTAMLSYEAPSFSTLTVHTSAGDTWTASAGIFCGSEAKTVDYIKFSMANPGSVKDGKVTATVGGTAIATTTDKAGQQVAVSKTFDTSTNKASLSVSLSGTSTLGASIPAKTVTVTAYMPVYCFIAAAQDEATVKSGLAAATAETTVYTGTHTIDKTGTFAAGGAWCVALPGHLAMTGIGTVADFGFGTQKTATTTVSATRTVNGIADVAYTVYLLPMGTAQASLPVRITTKAK